MSEKRCQSGIYNVVLINQYRPVSVQISNCDFTGEKLLYWCQDKECQGAWLGSVSQCDDLFFCLPVTMVTGSVSVEVNLHGFIRFGA